MQQRAVAGAAAVIVGSGRRSEAATTPHVVGACGAVTRRIHLLFERCDFVIEALHQRRKEPLQHGLRRGPMVLLNPGAPQRRDLRLQAGGDASLCLERSPVRRVLGLQGCDTLQKLLLLLPVADALLVALAEGRVDGQSVIMETLEPFHLVLPTLAPASEPAPGAGSSLLLRIALVIAHAFLAACYLSCGRVTWRGFHGLSEMGPSGKERRCHLITNMLSQENPTNQRITVLSRLFQYPVVSQLSADKDIHKVVSGLRSPKFCRFEDFEDFGMLAVFSVVLGATRRCGTLKRCLCHNTLCNS